MHNENPSTTLSKGSTPVASGKGGKRIRLRTPNKSITFNTNNGEQSEPLPIPFKKKERKEKTRNMKHETYPSVPGRYRHAWGRMKGALWTPR